MKTIGIVLKKELRRYFTDIRMILAIVLPGILIFVLYTIMGEFIQDAFSPTITDYVVYVENEPEEFNNMFVNPKWNISINQEDLSKDEIINKISEKEVDIYIVYPQNFYDNMLSYDAASGATAPNIEIYYNSSSDSSTAIYQFYSSVLNGMETAMTNKFDINNSNINYDLAKEEDISIMIFSMMLPFLLIIFLFSGAMGICAESISGEKERGTIATLLITPAKRSEIAIGKVVALGLTALCSSFVSFAGLLASAPKLIGGNVSLSVYDFSTIMMLLVVVIITAIFFTVLLTMVSTLAKSVKEATSLSIPVMLVVMMLGVTSFMSTTAQTNPALYLIPVYNSLQTLIGIFSMSVDPLCFVIFVISNIAYISLGVFLLTKMFNSEKIMFNK